MTNLSPPRMVVAPLVHHQPIQLGAGDKLLPPIEPNSQGAVEAGDRHLDHVQQFPQGAAKLRHFTPAGGQDNECATLLQVEGLHA